MATKKLNAMDLERDIVDAQLSGLSWDEIAVAYGFVSGQAAYKAWRRIVSKEYATTAEAVEEYRKIELSYLDNQLYILETAQQAAPDNLKIVDKIVGLLERRAKLLGLDAASKQDLSVTVNHEQALEMLDRLDSK